MSHPEPKKQVALPESDIILFILGHCVCCLTCENFLKFDMYLMARFPRY